MPDPVERIADAVKSATPALEVLKDQAKQKLEGIARSLSQTDQSTGIGREATQIVDAANRARDPNAFQFVQDKDVTHGGFTPAPLPATFNGGDLVAVFHEIIETVRDQAGRAREIIVVFKDP